MKYKLVILETGFDIILAGTMIFSFLMILNYFGLSTWPVNYFGACV
jgi:hypothetical protein